MILYSCDRWENKFKPVTCPKSCHSQRVCREGGFFFVHFSSSSPRAYQDAWHLCWTSTLEKENTKWEGSSTKWLLQSKRLQGWGFIVSSSSHWTERETKSRSVPKSLLIHNQKLRQKKSESVIWKRGCGNRYCQNLFSLYYFANF